MQTYFLIGLIVKDGSGKELGWMAEGLFLTEQEAIDAVKTINDKNLFLVEVKDGLFPKDATSMENIKTYFPLQETWEESALYAIKRFNLKKSKEMKYDPVTGELGVYPNFEDTYRNYHGVVAWLYNPWTGAKRDPRDVGSDVTGLLMYFP